MQLDRQALIDALPHADMRVLLMVLYHFTGDGKWLMPPYTPRRDVNLIAAEDAGFDDDMRAEICQAAADALLADTAPALPSPDEATLLTMMRHCLSEKVAGE